MGWDQRAALMALALGALTACGSDDSDMAGTTDPAEPVMVDDEAQEAAAPPETAMEPVAFELDADLIDRALTDMVDQGEVAGAVALIRQGGEEVYEGVVGLANLETEEEMTRYNLFQIYSMTKPITGVALMMLYEDGAFSLDDPLTEYFPEFADLQVLRPGDDGPVLEPLDRPITVMDIMRHTGGFTSGDADPVTGEIYREKDPMHRDRTLQEMITVLAEMPLSAQPGEAWIYGVSVDIQAALVERLSGQNFEDFLRERIFVPLRMRDTSYYVEEGMRDRFAVLYTTDAGGELTPVPVDEALRGHTSPWALTPGGWGLVSTADDYIRFAEMLLHGGYYNGQQLLKPETIELMSTDHLPAGLTDLSFLPSKGQVGFGLDFAVRTALPQSPDENPGRLGEFFWDGYASTMFWVDPASDLVAVLMVQKIPFDGAPTKRFRDAVYAHTPEAMGQ